MSKFEQYILVYYPYFHKFTLACVVCVLSYKAITYDFQPQQPSISWVLEVLAPDFWEDFDSAEPFDPTDFATN